MRRPSPRELADALGVSESSLARRLETLTQPSALAAKIVARL